MSRFILDVSYRQVAVFDAELEDPFNDWSDAHIAQGFAWRPGSVSFGTLDDGYTSIHVAAVDADAAATTSSAVRILEVPFDVPSHGVVEVGSIASSQRVVLPPGPKKLRCELGQTADGAWVTLTFVAASGPCEPRILRADEEVAHPPVPLVMTAVPA